MNMKNYNYLYEDGCLIIFKGKEVLHVEYIEELALVEDTICELQEEGLIPCINLKRIYR